MGINWANGFKTHNELTMYPLGNYPLAPSVSINRKHQRGQTLCHSFSYITHSLMETASKNLINLVDAVIRKSYPSLPLRIPIQINLINSDLAADCQGHSTPSVPSAKVAIVRIANYPRKG